MKRDQQTAFVRAMSLVIIFHVISSSAATSMADVEVTIENVEAASGDEVEVPISVRGATGLEGIQFVLTFDPQALEIIGVGAGPLAGAADVNLKERAPGTVRVAMLPESTLDRGEGTLLLAKFKTLAEAGQEVQIGIEGAKASEFREQFPMWMQVTTTSGVVSTVAAPAMPTWLWIAIAAAVILVLLLLSVFRRKKSS